MYLSYKYVMSKPYESGIVHLLDLPDRDVCLVLENKYKKEMLSMSKKLCGSWNNLARKLGLEISRYNNSDSLRNFRRKGVVRLDLIKKLSLFLVSNGYNNYSLENLENNLLLIKTKGRKGTINN